MSIPSKLKRAIVAKIVKSHAERSRIVFTESEAAQLHADIMIARNSARSRLML